MKSKSKIAKGRLRAAEKPARQSAVLAAALKELQQAGYEKLTMQNVAKRASCSKETLYSWFENKTGLLSSLIQQNADDSIASLETAFDSDIEPSIVLTGFCKELIGLLTSKPSISLNHASMSSAELAEILLSSGRYRVGPVVERYIGRLITDGYIKPVNEKRAFEVLYGLAISDLQIRVLLGEPSPKKQEISSRAIQAVDEFMELYAVK